MNTPIFPDERLAPYVQYDNNLKSWVAKGEYSLSHQDTFLTAIAIDIHGDRCWLDAKDRKSQVYGISALNQVQVWRCECVA